MSADAFHEALQDRYAFERELAATLGPERFQREMVGSKDRAVELLKPLVKVPNNLSKAWLRVDPTFDPLRKLPAFQALLQEGTT